MTIEQAVRSVRDSLVGYSDAPEIDAQWIVLSTIGKNSLSYLLSHADEEISETQQQQIFHMMKKRIQGVPLAYILGAAEFYGRPFIVTTDTLIPRPETEILIEKALEILPELGTTLGHPPVIADIGTGSGCIAITLALEYKNLSPIIATDISSAALEVAKQNAVYHGVADRIEFLQGDMLSPIREREIGMIVSNPPYVPTTEVTTAMHSLETKGLTFEPASALDGGPDGLLFVNQIVLFATENHIPAVIETIGGETFTVNI